MKKFEIDENIVKGVLGALNIGIFNQVPAKQLIDLYSAISNLKEIVETEKVSDVKS